MSPRSLILTMSTAKGAMWSKCAFREWWLHSRSHLRNTYYSARSVRIQGWRAHFLSSNSTEIKVGGVRRAGAWRGDTGIPMVTWTRPTEIPSWNQGASTACPQRDPSGCAQADLKQHCVRVGEEPCSKRKCTAQQMPWDPQGVHRAAVQDLVGIWLGEWHQLWVLEHNSNCSVRCLEQQFWHRSQLCSLRPNKKNV